jgi:hypothetical protein
MKNVNENEPKPNLPSASGVKLAMTCSQSIFLPQEQKSESADDMEAADKGTAVHDYLDRVSMGMDGAEALLMVKPEFRDDCLSVEVDDIPKLSDLRTEVAIAWNPWTKVSRILGDHLGRDYSGADRSSEFVGTADRIGRMVGGEYDGWFVVDDYKTGSARTVDHVEKNWQTLTLAVAFAAQFKLDKVLVGIIKTKGQVRPYYHPLEGIDLAMGAQALKDLADIAASGKGEYVQGDHCKYCPCFVYCEKKLEIAVNIVKKPELTMEYISNQIQSDPTTAYSRWRQVKQVIHKLDGIMRAHAEKNPIPLANGVVYGAVSVTKNEIDAKVAFEAIFEKHGAEVAKAALTLDASKAGIERAIGAIAPKGKKAAMVREALKDIADRGGVKVMNKTEVREHVPGEVVDAE